jgi:hypothetical protein
MFLCRVLEFHFIDIKIMIANKKKRFLGSSLQCCLHATVLLAVKYSAELNKYILLVRVICEKYRFREQSNFPRRYGGSENWPLLSTGIFRK